MRDNDEPFVVLRLTDSEATRAIWPHAFELFYEARRIARPAASPPALLFGLSRCSAGCWPGVVQCACEGGYCTAAR